MNVSLRGVSKSYGWQRHQALRDIDLDIPAGQIVAVVGANGAGKTTLLRLLATLAVPTTGTIFFDDQRLHRERIDLRKRLFFLADTPAVFTHKSVAGHLAAVLKVYERDTPAAARRAAEILADFDLLPFLERQLRELSRGQKYKAALTAMIVADCELWLIDEPFTAGIDPLGQAVLRREMRAAADRGRTIVFSTQILQIAERVADSVCVLHQGRMHAFDEVGALVNQVSNTDLESILTSLRDSEESDVAT